MWLTGCQECPSDPKMWRDWQAAMNVPLTQKCDVTDRLPGMSLWPKNVTWLTGFQECPSDPKMWCDWQDARNVPLTQKRDVTDRLPGMSLWPKNVTWLAPRLLVLNIVYGIIVNDVEMDRKKQAMGAYLTLPLNFHHFHFLNYFYFYNLNILSRTLLSRK